MSEFSTGTEQKKIDLICSRWLDLKSKRSSYLNQWRAVSRYVSPFSGRFDITDKNNVRDTRFILDAEASHDLNILASGLMSGASSPARPWFKVEPNDQALNNVVTRPRSDVTTIHCNNVLMLKSGCNSS